MPNNKPMVALDDPDERAAWDAYAAAALGGAFANNPKTYAGYVDAAAEQADRLIEERRKRFKTP